MSPQDFEQTLRDWLRRGEASDGSAGPDPHTLWREGRRRRARRVLMGGAAGLGLVAAAAAGVLAIGGGLLPEATDTGPAQPSVTAPTVSPEEPEETGGPEVPTQGPTAPEDTGDDAGADDAEQTAGADEQGWGEPLAECSTGAYTAPPPDTEGLPEPVAETVTALVRDAMRCDEQALITRAQQDETSLSFGGGSAQELLSIPAEDPRYLKLVVMLSATSWATMEGDGETLYVWPAAHAPSSTEADWQEVLQAGLHSQEEIDRMPGPGEAYFGWRTGISETGEWRFLIAGD